ncbi:MAG: acetyl-CoA carboxylase biotin carboxyl carrier protein subunit [Deltaproteobacteria bacterium HGW-Deltaproteobacteria-12]|jgi:acetyl-CoA carboxylase biotin carboxyl carrier protein|nr:MAG: acetyl-CoA carboxylase biotin carboxyl carrier protein subunit [Deltaproteobacteria bacterium HGW-Deltaproteobacteria-12]
MIEVKSDVSGLVLEILVKKGDQVGKKQALIMLESVKMEIPVESPEAGKVFEIKVKEEDLVEEGQIVALLEV